MDKSDMMCITGFPDYRWNPDTEEMISFHVDWKGRVRKINYGENGERGYQLYYRGKRKFFSVKALRAEAELFKISKILKKEKVMSVRVPKKGDFLVGSLTKSNGAMSFSAYPGCHETLPKANQEATRLAQTVKDKKFIVVEVKGIASCQDVVWE